jgi:hypothetical protein
MHICPHCIVEWLSAALPFLPVVLGKVAAWRK